MTNQTETEATKTTDLWKTNTGAKPGPVWWCSLPPCNLKPLGT